MEAAETRRGVRLIWGGWVAFTGLAALLAAALDAPWTTVTAGATIMALPGLLQFWIAERWGESWALSVAGAAWISLAAVASALSGGHFSPATLGFAVAPALAAAGAGRWPAVALTFWAAVGYGLATLVAGYARARGIEAPAVFPFPEAVGAGGLVAAGAMVALAARERRAATERRDPAVAQAVAGPDEATSRYVAELSHELRTPLTHIMGFAELMERETFGPLGERYASYAGLIRSSGAHLLSLVNDLLDLSRIQEGRLDLDLAETDVAALAQDVYDASAPSAAEKGLTFTLERPDAPLRAVVDARAVRQILLNLTSNAIKFSPANGAAALAVRADNDMLILEARDDGPGIPEKERAALGERFVRGHAAVNVSGSGLGLSLVRALAGLHGGGLSFADAPEGGALVRVTMPLEPAPEVIQESG